MFENLETVQKKTTLNQQRIIIGCVFELPQEVREKTPQNIVQKCTGDLLLSFNFIPTIGTLFPYGGQVWRVPHEPIQSPTKYRSHQTKSPAVLFPEWVCSYESEREALLFILLASKATS
jgi:hypothetical protein